MKQYIEKILKARVYDVAQQTPLDLMRNLSQRLNNHVMLKREDLQPVFSFKLRGAYNKIVNLPPDIAKKGVITASAGNHAQGVALAASKLGIRSLIVMPRTTPDIKVASVRNLGGTITLHGDTYDEAYQHAVILAEQNGMTFVHPYDDPDVIAGQGTVAMEILRQHTDPLHAIFVPVGGGGLIAGVAVYVKYLWPEIKVIGVEPEDAASMHDALRSGERTVLNHVGIFADGVAVKQAGKEPFRIAQLYVDEIILVNTDEICAAIKDIFDDTRSIAEPAGALGVAGLKKYIEREGVTAQRMVAIDSGANMNFGRLRHVAERAEVGERHEAILAVTIPERPGSFGEFCHVIGDRSITEFNYRYADVRGCTSVAGGTTAWMQEVEQRRERLPRTPGATDAATAHVFVGIKLTQGDEERHEIVQCLKDALYPVIDMTENEMAKLHVRYMVGGHPPVIEHERIYRFEFPERPGALLRFLDKMGRRWNISLFHYRNHGDAYGRVLVGVQVPPVETAAFQDYLADLSYAYEDETENPAYRLFLS